jgi:hypothetical protein
MVVRPGRKNGGTTLLFRLTRPAVVRVTIVRVYPSCRHFGSFTIRADAGVNRVRFRGRLRGRPLPSGGYRLIFRARGAQRDVAAIPIVIAREPMTVATLHKARHATVCRDPIADFGSDTGVPPSGTRSDDDRSAGGVLGEIKKTIEAPVKTAAGAIAKATRGFTERVTDASDDPFQDPVVLTLIGLFALASAALGGMALVGVVRATRDL